jgi:ribosomal protein L33
MIPVTFTITTCNRLDLLEKTLSTFNKFNTYRIDEWLMINDSDDKSIEEKLYKKYNNKFNIKFNNPKQGLAKSLDWLFSNAKNEYIFHCEDDWEFDNYFFLEKSLDIMKYDPSINQVWIRHQEDMIHKLVGDRLITNNGIGYYLINPNCNNWNGFSYNPGLRRKSDYIKMFPNGMSSIGNEYDCSIYSKKFNYKVVTLEDTTCKHIGYTRTENFKD